MSEILGSSLLLCGPQKRRSCISCPQSLSGSVEPQVDSLYPPGIFVIGFSYPVVPKGKARIRVQISAVHSEEDIDRCVEAFVEVGRLHGALP